jgi:enterochelin esterase-like enzyme
MNPLDLAITHGPVVYVVYAVALAAVVVLVVRRPSRRWMRRRWFAEVAVAAVAGAALGLGLTWLLSDRLDLFGADLTGVVRAWITVGCAAFGIAVVSMRRASWMRVVASALALVLFVLTTAMAVNIDFGQFPTVRSVLGISAIPDESTQPLPPTAQSTAADSAPSFADWVAPATMPKTGTLTTVTIPASESGFAARPAVVYLPPAALTDDPPRLPVLIMMSGQPGSPEDPLVTNRLQQSLDAYAAAHDGLAPIVVSPDQLGEPTANPMCVDSPLGNSQSYLTVDVPNWIRSNLTVIDDAHYWGIGGLSQGGTCSIQLGAQFPNLFGVILDASGEEYPRIGDPQKTADAAFGGSLARYEAAYPASIMQQRAPYSDTFAVFGVGSNDDAFVPQVKAIYADAQAAGMTASYLEAQGSAHDVTTWSYVFAQGLLLIADHWQLSGASG